MSQPRTRVFGTRRMPRAVRGFLSGINAVEIVPSQATGRKERGLNRSDDLADSALNGVRRNPVLRIRSASSEARSCWLFPMNRYFIACQYSTGIVARSHPSLRLHAAPNAARVFSVLPSVEYTFPEMRNPALAHLKSRLFCQIIFSLCVLFVLRIPTQAQPSTNGLQIYTVDVEGGQATLLVAPSGSSLWSTLGGRGIMAATPSAFRRR